MRLGAYACEIEAGTLAHSIYKTDRISERHRHRYEFNNEYKKQFTDAGMKRFGSGWIWLVKTKDNKTEAAIRNNDKEQAATIQIKYPMISILFDTTKMATNTVALSGIMQSVEQWSGSGTIGSGQWVDWSATFVSTVIADAKKDDKKPAGTLGAITYPLVPFGWEQSPQAKQYLIRNATVWTNERDGIMRETDVLVKLKISEKTSPLPMLLL